MGKKSKRRQNKGGKAKNSSKNQGKQKQESDARNQNINNNNNNESEDVFPGFGCNPDCQCPVCREQKVLKKFVDDFFSVESEWDEDEDGRIRFCTFLDMRGRIMVIVHNTVIGIYKIFSKEKFDFVREKRMMILVKVKNDVAAKLLGVDQEASIEDINRKFRRLSLQYHPDKYNPAKHEDSDGTIIMTKAEVEEKFKALSDARDEMVHYREQLAGGGDNDHDDDRSTSS